MSELPTTRPSVLVRLRDRQDDQAWTEFVQIYEPFVYRFARQQGFQDADAADLVQEVLVAVASAVHRWDPDRSRGKFRNWLLTVARNELMDLFTARRRHPQGSGKTEIRRLLEQQPAPSDADAFRVELRRQVFRWAAERIRGEFRENTWRAFWLTTVEQKDIRDVCERLGLTVGAIYKCRSRVMARLRQTVEQFEEM